MCTARPGWQTMSFRIPLYKKQLFNIDVNLVDILEVDSEKKVKEIMIDDFNLQSSIN